MEEDTRFTDGLVPPIAWPIYYRSEHEEEPDVRSTNARSRQRFCPENQ